MSLPTGTERVRAFGYFIIAGIYFLFAQIVASHSTAGLSSGEWSVLIERFMLLFLVLVGYGFMGRAFNQQRHPLQAMGLVFRAGWRREFGLGAALGWGMLLVSILPTVLLGGLIVTVWTSPHQIALLGIDLLVMAVAALVEEVVFRGYPFQRLVQALGPTLATLVLSGIFGVAHAMNPGANRASLMVTIFSGWVLCAGYLRTRALWFSWGCHFAWNASMGLLIGLPVSGLTRFSSVIQSNTIGPAWITGGDYGPEASLVTAIVMLAGLILIFRLTRTYAYDYAQPVILPAGMPVDLDAMGRVVAPHHPTPASERLVQINSFGTSSSSAAGSPMPDVARPSEADFPDAPSSQSDAAPPADILTPPKQADE